jgi:hypothetical protein
MRISTVTAAFLWSMTAAAAGNDAPRCYRDFSAPPYTNCSFYAARPCVTAAAIMGGVCERNHRVPPPPGKNKREPS